MASTMTCPPGVFQTFRKEDPVYWGGETEIELSLVPGGWLTDCGVFNLDEDDWMIDELMVAVEEEHNKGLDLAINQAEEDYQDSLVVFPEEDDEVFDVLREADEDFEYEEWLNSKQYNKSLEEYNRHKLLAYEKGYSPNWAGECTGDFARTTKSQGKSCVLYQTSLKDRFVVDAVIQTEFPQDRGNKAYAKASSSYGDIYIPYRFYGYIGHPGSPQRMTVALQDVGDGNRKANGFRWTCIYTH